MSTTSTSGATAIHPVLKELLSIDSSKTKNGDKAKQQQQSPKILDISALDMLQHLLETNVVSSDQLKATHASLKELKENAIIVNNASKNTAAEAKPDNQDSLMPPAPPTPEYRTRHIALRIYYEGKLYGGLAETVGMENDNSVERKVFAALVKTHLIQSRATCGFSRCGRTDKGVSAVGQVIAMRLKSAIPLEASWDEEGKHIVANNNVEQQEDNQQQQQPALPKNSIDAISVWVTPRVREKKIKNKKKKAKHNHSPPQQQSTTQAPPPVDAASPPQPRQQKDIAEIPYDKLLNSVLPDDIRVLGWCPVSEEFSARFSASDRKYRYFFVRRPDMDLEAMREGLQLMVGTHDFRNLCKLNVVEVSNYVRKIHAADIVPCSSIESGGGGGGVSEGDVYYFQIQGQAFLWHQIRCIVEVIFMIGRRLEPPSIVTELLDVEKYPGKPSYPPATEFPLVLHECGYPNLQMGYSVQNLWNLTCQMEGQWETIVLEAARVRNCLEMLQKDVRVVRKSDLRTFAKLRLLERIKKQKRNVVLVNKQKECTSFIEQLRSEENDSSKDQETNFMTWAEGIEWLNRFQIVPGPDGLRDYVHIPLMERSKGTTYEEKIQSIQKDGSTKRSQRYEENAAKKRKSKGTDADFYDHMMKQGGSAH